MSSGPIFSVTKCLVLKFAALSCVQSKSHITNFYCVKVLVLKHILTLLTSRMGTYTIIHIPVQISFQRRPNNKIPSNTVTNLQSYKVSKIPISSVANNEFQHGNGVIFHHSQIMNLAMVIVEYFITRK
jgi:hypothetical protein